MCAPADDVLGLEFPVVPEILTVAVPLSVVFLSEYCVELFLISNVAGSVVPDTAEDSPTDGSAYPVLPSSAVFEVTISVPVPPLSVVTLDDASEVTLPLTRAALVEVDPVPPPDVDVAVVPPPSDVVLSDPPASEVVELYERNGLT